MLEWRPNTHIGKRKRRTGHEFAFLKFEPPFETVWHSSVKLCINRRSSGYLK